MMPIDTFINQLIQLGLAESFLDIIDKHYLKITKIYNIIIDMDENNIKYMNLIQDIDNDSITIILELNEPVDNLINNSDKEISVQIINDGNTVEISVINNYESEEEIYENRFNGCRTPYTHKWS